MSFTRSAMLLSVCFLCAQCLAAPAGLHALLDVAELAMPPDAQMKMAATTAGEGDGQDYMLLAPGQTATVLTVKGPAVIHRIWSTAQMTDQTRLAVKLDGKEQVIWAQAKLPEGQAAGDPLRAMDGQAYWSYIPLKVNQKAELIATDLREPKAGKPGVAETGTEEGNKFYLQVAYTEGEGNSLSDQQVEEVRKRLRLFTDNPLAGTADIVVEGDGKAPKVEKITLSPGKPARIAGDPKAFIQTLVIDAGDASFEQLQSTRLVIKSDGSADACVDVPVPYLFCAFFGLDDYSGAVTAIKDNKLVFRIPIPIGNGLEISTDKFGGGKPAGNLELTLVKGTAAEAIPYRFCAEYRSIVSERGEPLHLADIKGEGVFLGGAFAGAAQQHRKLAFLEGNEQIYVDDAEKPTWEGTGTEDYFNGAWYFSAGVNARAFHGLTTLDENPPPKMASYRYLLPDRIAFRTSLKFDMQHGSRNSVPGIIYQSVSFWYQKPPCKVAEPAQGDAPAGGAPAVVGEDEGGGGDIDLVTPTILTIIILVFGVAAFKAISRKRR